MALSNADRQRLIEATRQHRSRLGLDRKTGKITNTITRRTTLAAACAALVARLAGKRGPA